jgi:hypothetical protein
MCDGQPKLNTIKTILPWGRLSCCDAINFYYALFQEQLRSSGGDTILVQQALGNPLTPFFQSYSDAIDKLNQLVRESYDQLKKCNNKSCCFEGALAIITIAADILEHFSKFINVQNPPGEFQEDFVNEVFRRELAQFKVHAEFIVSVVNQCGSGEEFEEKKCNKIMNLVNENRFNTCLIPTLGEVNDLTESRVLNCCGALVLNYAQLIVRAFNPFVRYVINRVTPPIEENQIRNLFEFDQQVRLYSIIRKYYRQLACCDPCCCMKTAEGLGRLALSAIITINNAVTSAAVVNGTFIFNFTLMETESISEAAIARFQKEAQFLLRQAC